jgi:adenine deaminase-like protein
LPFLSSSGNDERGWRDPSGQRPNAFSSAALGAGEISSVSDAAAAGTMKQAFFTRGVFATRPPKLTAADLAGVNEALWQIGCKLSSPVLGLSFVALTTIPYYGMTEAGLYDVEQQRFVPVVLSRSANSRQARRS